MFLHAYTDKPEIELALCKSYNRWIAARRKRASDDCAGWRYCRCCRSTNRSRRSVGRKDHGACGVCQEMVASMRPRGQRPYFSHLRGSQPPDMRSVSTTRRGTSKRTVAGNGLGGGMIAISAFSALAEHGVPDKFPKLRVGFHRNRRFWVPFLHAELMAKMLRRTFSPIDVKKIYFASTASPSPAIPTTICRISKYGPEDSLMSAPTTVTLTIPRRSRLCTSSSGAVRAATSLPRVARKIVEIIRAGSTGCRF